LRGKGVSHLLQQRWLGEKKEKVEWRGGRVPGGITSVLCRSCIIFADIALLVRAIAIQYAGHASAKSR
jgi:hypothetical protein